MKVLLIFRSPVGGLFRHVRDLLVGLRSAGHDVAVVCGSGICLKNDAGESLKKSANLGLICIPIPRHPGVRDVMVLHAITRLHRGHKFDVVHGHGAKGGLFARLLKLSTGIKTTVIYTLHGGTLHYSKKSLTGLIYFWLERRLLKYTDGIIFESNYVQGRFSRVIQYPSCPFRIIYHGLYKREFTLIRRDMRKFDFIFLGELRQLKGVDVMLRAMQLVQLGGRDVSLAVFGEGPDEAFFRKLAVTLGLVNIHWLGAVSKASEAFMYGRCLIVPSRAESFSYVVLEAVAMGVTIIATRVGAVPEILGDSYPLIEQGDHKALAKMMVEFLEDEFAFKCYKARGGVLASNHFFVEHMINKTLAFYDSSIAKQA